MRIRKRSRPLNMLIMNHRDQQNCGGVFSLSESHVLGCVRPCRSFSQGLLFDVWVRARQDLCCGGDTKKTQKILVRPNRRRPFTVPQVQNLNCYELGQSLEAIICDWAAAQVEDLQPRQTREVRQEDSRRVTLRPQWSPLPDSLKVPPGASDVTGAGTHSPR